MSPGDESETLRWQFRLCWKLAEIHLPALTDESCLWEPARGSWSVRSSEHGDWRPDWADPGPLRLTIAWATSELMKNIAEIGCVRHLFAAMRGMPQR